MRARQPKNWFCSKQIQIWQIQKQKQEVFVVSWIRSPDGFCHLPEAQFGALRLRLWYLYFKNTNTNVWQIRILNKYKYCQIIFDTIVVVIWWLLPPDWGSLWGRGSEAPSRYSSISPQGNSLHFCFAFLFISLPAGPVPCIYISHNLSRNKHRKHRKTTLYHNLHLVLPGPSWPHFRVLHCHDQGSRVYRKESVRLGVTARA